MRLCEISVEKLHASAKKAKQAGDYFRNLAAAQTDPRARQVLKHHAEHAYDAQAARFINRANKKQGKSYKDLSHEAIHAQDPLFAQNMRAHRRARTERNQKINKIKKEFKKTAMVGGAALLAHGGLALLKHRRNLATMAHNKRVVKGALMGLGGGTAAVTAAGVLASRKRHKNKESASCVLCNLVESNHILLIESRKKHHKSTDTQHVIKHIGTHTGVNIGGAIGGTVGTGAGIAGAALLDRYARRHGISIKNILRGRVGHLKHPMAQAAARGGSIAGGATLGTIGGAVGGGVVGRKVGKFVARDRD